MLVTLFGIVTLVRELQFLNAYSPMLVTLEPRVTSFNIYPFWLVVYQVGLSKLEANVLTFEIVNSNSPTVA